MKKTTIALLLAFCSSAALAASDGGFHSDEAPPPPEKQDSGIRGSEDTRPTPISQAKGMREGAWVTLEGNIQKKLGKDTYQFRDKSGSLQLKIAPDGWHGANISPEDLVIISGAIHKSHNEYVVDVRQLQKQ